MKTNLESDGYFCKRSFLDLQQVSTILSDLDKVFVKPSVNGYVGYNIISNVVKCAPNPFVDIINFSTLLLLDEISNILTVNGYDMSTYALAEFEALAEQGDSKPLEYHNDQFEGNDAFIVLIYLKGGGVESGGAKYIAKSHKKEVNINDHYITNDQLTTLKNDIIDLSGGVGDLVCYNLRGFHSRHPTKLERISLRLIFNNKFSDKNTFDNFIIPLHLLKSGIPKILYLHDSPLYLIKANPPLNIKYILNILVIYLKDLIHKCIRKITSN